MHDRASRRWRTADADIKCLDRLAQKQHRETQAQTQAAADHAQVRKAKEHERLEHAICVLIPLVLKRLAQMDPEESGMQSLTYEVARVPRFGHCFGWRTITRAAWEIGQWTIPTSASSMSTPVWLLSNGLIGYNGLNGEPMASTIGSVAELWPTMLPIILAGLRQR